MSLPNPPDGVQRDELEAGDASGSVISCRGRCRGESFCAADPPYHRRVPRLEGVAIGLVGVPRRFETAGLRWAPCAAENGEAKRANLQARQEHHTTLAVAPGGSPAATRPTSPPRSWRRGYRLAASPSSTAPTSPAPDLHWSNPPGSDLSDWRFQALVAT